MEDSGKLWVVGQYVTGPAGKVAWDLVGVFDRQDWAQVWCAVNDQRFMGTVGLNEALPYGLRVWWETVEYPNGTPRLWPPMLTPTPQEDGDRRHCPSAALEQADQTGQSHLLEHLEV